jgi:hypothetical protein
MSKEKMASDAEWLEEASRYFEKRPTCGEDMAFWANVSNAERCRSIAKSLCSKPVVVVDVKPLEWSKTQPSCVADTPVGTWEIRYDGLGDNLKATGLHSFTVWWEDALCLGQFQLIEEAKAVAEADYRQRILSALILPTHKPLQEEG